MTDPADLLAAGIDHAATSSPSGWSPPTPEALVGIFPQLEILALIGHGGMGAVYKARQTHLDRTVAVKLLSAERGADPAFVERFTREARALARLQHPHIVTLYDFGRAGSWLYLVMEYVDGANLRQLLATGRLNPPATLRLVAPLCEALVHAHAQGVVHRDLKPENILIDSQGQPKIADFGLAKLRCENGNLTQTGDTLGTLHYMSPEQVSGTGCIDHRADIYALGVILYEMLTGNLPIGRCLPPSQSGSDPRLDEVVLKSLEREPEKRWQSIEELRQAVVGAQTSELPSMVAQRAGTRPWNAKAAWGFTLALALGILVLWLRQTPSHPAYPPVSLIADQPEIVNKNEPRSEESAKADVRLDEAVREAKRLETMLAAMELRKSDMERRVKELAAQTAQAEADAAKANTALESARLQQTQLANEVDRLGKQRLELAAQLEATVKATRTKEVEAIHRQEQADMLAKTLADRMPGPAPAAPIQLELRYDRENMATIGRVVRADGGSEDMAPVPWPRDGAKILVSAAKATIEHRYAEILITHQRAIDERQNHIREILVQVDELERLDLSGRHVELITNLKKLGGEKP